MKIKAGIMTLEILFNKLWRNVRLVINAQSGGKSLYQDTVN